MNEFEMNDLQQSTFLKLSASFSSTSCCFSSGITSGIKSLLLSLSLRVFVVVFIHGKENWQCFSRLLSLHFPPCFDHVPSGVHHCLMYHDRDTFDFI